MKKITSLRAADRTARQSQSLSHINNKTIQDLLTKATKSIELFDAQLLLAHVTHTSREFVIAHPEYKTICQLFEKQVEIFNKTRLSN